MVWFREDVTIVEDNRTRISVNEDGRNQYSVILELNDVVETDAGLYKVKAKNKYGEVSASINLNFSRKYFYFLVLLLFAFYSVEASIHPYFHSSNVLWSSKIKAHLKYGIHDFEEHTERE